MTSDSFIHSGRSANAGVSLEALRRSQEWPTITVLVCAVNEEGTLPLVLTAIPEWVDEVIVVDGGSNDETVALAKNARPGVRVLVQPGRGKGAAIKYGIRQCTGDIVVLLDADGQTDPRELPCFVGPLVSGFDFAKGTRFTDRRPSRMALHRWFGNRVLVGTFNLLYGTQFTDICSGYNAFWRKEFERLRLGLDGFEMEQQMVARAVILGLRIAEVPHTDYGRSGGVSKTSDLRQGLTDLLIVLQERFRRRAAF